jgi:acyl-CoA reductase-like NAD-dependent aldehyde dehydrogenase
LFGMQDIEEAIRINNSVPQGLSSSLFTMNMQHVFRWMGSVFLTNRLCVVTENSCF